MIDMENTKEIGEIRVFLHKKKYRKPLKIRYWDKQVSIRWSGTPCYMCGTPLEGKWAVDLVMYKFGVLRRVTRITVIEDYNGALNLMQSVQAAWEYGEPSFAVKEWLLQFNGISQGPQEDFEAVSSI